MAYRRRFKRSYRPYRRNYRRSYNMARRRYGYRRGGRKGGFGISTNWILGAAAGYFLPQSGMLDVLITAAAVAPMRLGQVKPIAQGYVGAKILKSFMASGTTGSNGSEVV